MASDIAPPEDDKPRDIPARKDYRRGRGLVGRMALKYVTVKNSTARPSKKEKRILCPSLPSAKSSPRAVFPEMFTIERNPLSCHRARRGFIKSLVKSAKKYTRLARGDG
jgi:hypothetical protein